jgi:DNA helicase HerA-like ATPase
VKASLSLGSEVGYVLSSDFVEGIIVRVVHTEAMSLLRIGQLLIIESDSGELIFAQVANLRTDWFPELKEQPRPLTVPRDSKLLQDVFIQKEITVKAMKAYRDVTLLAVRSLAMPGMRVRFATDEDIALIYGPRDNEHIYLGEPLEMQTPIVIPTKEFIERSNGIFGKSGTGKSFLARIVLAELIRMKKVATLIFDMHSEYGWETTSEQGVGKVKGLRQLFPSQVLIFALDENAAKARGVKPDYILHIPSEMITVEDVGLLAEELDLSQAMLDALEIMTKRMGKNWLKQIAEINPMDIKNQAEYFGVMEGTLQALYRKLNRVASLPFLQNEDTAAWDQLVVALEHGKSVILEFGHYNSLMTYMLVSNILTRHIHRHYVRATEKFLQSGDVRDKVTPLMIVIEEAHKFLQGRVARNTTFGTIAREMRKFSVTLLVIDQRPSSIDREILSQLGTRIVAMLNDPDDIEAVFTGVADKQLLRYWLATLDSKKQVLLLGHAVPIPTMVRVRNYDEEFYRSMRTEDGATVEELFG